MIKPVPKSHKIIGILAILFGLVAFIPLINFENNNLIFTESKKYLIRYSLIISFISGGLYFIGMGILQYVGVLVPYYLAKDNEYEKAKNHVFSFVLMSPFLFVLSMLLFFESDNLKFKFLWSLMVLFFTWNFASGIKIIRKSLNK